VAEYALLVRTDLQGHDLGWTLLSHIIEYARADEFGRIGDIVLGENDTMLTMCRESGFSVSHHPDEPGLERVTLALGSA